MEIRQGTTRKVQKRRRFFLMSNYKEGAAVLLENFTYWKNKNLYLELMERFMDEKIDGTQFETEFYKMWRRDRDKTYRSKELLQIAEHVDLTKLKGFSGILSKLFTDCDVFQPDPALRDFYEISEEELKNYVKEAFLKIKNGYP
jgi:hypothetical protein